MFNTTDSTLNELYFFIDKIKDRLSHDELNELTDIYNELTLGTEEIQELENDLFQLEENEVIYSSHIDSTTMEIESLFDRWDDEKPVHELMEKVSSIIERELNIPEQETNTQVLQENEILKMVKQGYKFISGLGAKIYNDYVNKEQQNEIKRQKEKQYKALKQSIPLPNASVRAINENEFSVSAYQVDAIVNLETEKVKGKGARSYKDELLERVKFFIQYEQDLAF